MEHQDISVFIQGLNKGGQLKKKKKDIEGRKYVKDYESSENLRIEGNNHWVQQYGSYWLP